jgi:hypothetical protein
MATFDSLASAYRECRCARIECQAWRKSPQTTFQIQSLVFHIESHCAINQRHRQSMVLVTAHYRLARCNSHSQLALVAGSLAGGVPSFFSLASHRAGTTGSTLGSHNRRVQWRQWMRRMCAYAKYQRRPPVPGSVLLHPRCRGNVLTPALAFATRRASHTCDYVACRLL